MKMEKQLSTLFNAYKLGHFYQLQKEDEYRYTKLWRPRYIVQNRFKQVTLEERFDKWNHARDEARTLARRIVRLCREQQMSYSFLYSFEFAKNRNNDYPNGFLESIKGKHPKGVVAIVHKAILDYEAASVKRDIRHISSIRPVISKDNKGYLVQSVTFIDGSEGLNIFYSI